MLIGIDASQANRTKRRGTEWYAYQIIQELKKIADPQDQFVLYSKKPLHGDLAELPANFSNKVLRWPPVFMWNQLRLTFETMLHPPDVLFCPAHTIPFFPPRHTVTTLHDVGFEMFKELYSKKRIGPSSPILRAIFSVATRIMTLGKYSNSELDYHRWSARRALKKAHTITTVSEFSKQEIQRLISRPKNEIQIIPNGIDHNVFFPRSEAERQEILNKYQITKPYFFWIGSLEEKKNVITMIMAFETYKKKYGGEHALVLAGLPGGYGYDKIQEAMEESSVKDDIMELGYVPYSDTPLLYSGAECFLWPSMYEGFGIPIVEAMACRVPIIASCAGSNPEVARDAALFFDPKSAEECAEQMHTTLVQKEETQARIEKGVHIAKMYSWERTAKTIYKLLHKTS